MPFTERRMFFKKDRVVVRNLGRAVLLIGVLLLGWELSTDHGAGNEQRGAAPRTEPTMSTAAAFLKTDVKSENDAPVRVRVISHTLAGYKKSLPRSFNDGVHSPAPASAANPDRAARRASNYAPALRLASEPPESALVTSVGANSESRKARVVQPKAIKRRHATARSQRPRRLRSQAETKPSGSNSQPLLQNLPKWADKALFEEVR